MFFRKLALLRPTDLIPIFTPAQHDSRCLECSAEGRAHASRIPNAQTASFMTFNRTLKERGSKVRKCLKEQFTKL